MIDVDAGLAKHAIHEQYKLRFEATFTNVINHTNYAPPALNIGEASSFGVLNTALLQGQGGNRTGQIAFRLRFLSIHLAKCISARPATTRRRAALFCSYQASFKE